MRTRLHDWAPRWWAGEGGPAGRVLDVLLWPAEKAFHAGVRARNLAYDRGWLAAATAPVPVVSVGNIGVGGAGKTPFVAWLVRRLAEAGRRPSVVMRGYGEDEILVHRELNPEVPVIASRRRIDGAVAAASAGADVVVLDDGFQHRALARTLDIVLVAAETWASRRRLLPRGGWREGAEAFQRAHLVVVTRKVASVERAAAVRKQIRSLVAGVPVASCAIRPTALTPLHGSSRADGFGSLGGERILAVASLADPQPFLEHLRHAGAAVELDRYPDHHPFDERDAEAIVTRAAGRPIVMTLKEAVKLRRLFSASVPAFVLQQQVEIEHGRDAVDLELQRTFRCREGR